MWIIRCVSPGWQSEHHTGSPGIAAKYPVETGLFHLPVTVITTQAPVPVTLDCKADGQIIAAPDIWYSPVKCIGFCFLPNFIDALFVKSYQSIPAASFHFFCQLVMAEVNKRIPLVVFGSILPKP